MLKLISCELAKLRRKKFIPFVILSAFLFPPPLAVMMLTPHMMDRYDTKAEFFDAFYQYCLVEITVNKVPDVCVICASAKRRRSGAYV